MRQKQAAGAPRRASRERRPLDDDPARVAEFEALHPRGPVRGGRAPARRLRDEERPRSSWGWYALGYAYFAQQKLGEAIQALAQSLELDVKNAEAHKILGRTLMIIGRFDAAQLEFEEGIRLKPDSAEMHYNLGKLFSVQDNWEPARKALEAARPPRPDVPRGAGRPRVRARGPGRRRGRGRAATSRRSRSTRQRQGRFVSAHVSLSAYYNRTGDPDKALEYARQALELDPKSDAAWFQQAKAQERLGRLAEAVDSLNQAIALNPRASAHYYVLANLYRRLGKADESRKALDSFKRLEREASELEKMRREQPRDAPAAPSGRSVSERLRRPRTPVAASCGRSERRRGRGPRCRGAGRARPLFAAAARRAVVFTDVTAAAGLLRATNVSGSPDDKQLLLEEMGGGAAFFDYDHDGWLDIFLVNGTSLDPAVRDRRPRSYLFHNNRDGTFTDVTEKAGLTHSGWGQGCCVGDYDNDGLDDLFVTYWGKSVLYHNNGDGTFTDVSEKAGVAGSPTGGAPGAASWTTTATGTWTCSSPAT